VSLGFLSSGPANGAIARSPMERMAKAAGAEFELQAGWNVAVNYAGEDESNGSVAWADVSHLRKFELQGAGVPGEFGQALRDGGRWVCRLTETRTIVIGGEDPPEGALEVTCNYGALTILGPQAREAIARFCALDLRPEQAPPNTFRPGSIARQPGMILVQAEHRFLLLFGWALGEYMWTVVADAARSLGGAPVGVHALREAVAHA
jgi:glycine cleavage system aminomethyltransferase T